MLNVERGTTSYHSNHSNLVNFLQATTPILPVRHLPLRPTNIFDVEWHPWTTQSIEFFTMGDVWESYSQWSAYGAGIPVQLNNRERVVQYYVPFLSGVEIYLDRKNPCYRELLYKAMNETDKLRTLTPDDCCPVCTVVEKQPWKIHKKFGSLLFQYYETSTPYHRLPFSDMMRHLSGHFYELSTLRSIDVLAPSWMSVAWYPIYRIPTGRTVKDLSTCFLTYHTLSSTFIETEKEQAMGIPKWKGRNISINLPAFGMAAHRLHGDVWLSDEDGDDEERINSLHGAAESWIKQLDIQQHDFRFFNEKRRGKKYSRSSY